MDILLLVRLSSELMLKSDRVRRRFLSILVNNMRDALTSTGHKFSIESERTRIFVRLDEESGIAALQRVFGIHSLAKVEGEAPSELDEIVRVGFETFRPRLREGESFAVDARRAGKQLPFTSVDVCRQLGSAINVGVDRVDLSNPDRVFRVEVRPDKTYFFGDFLPGPGGLPLGSAGRGVCLISGGFDSPVAAWMLMKRGIAMDFVLCNLAGDAFEKSVIQISQQLAHHWSYGKRPDFYSVDFSEVARAIRDSVGGRYTQVVLKRAFYRVGCRMARRLAADAVVTGEALGQVSSQTLQNLRAIDDAATMPVFRPLIGFDKEDIIAMSQKIGTHDLSAKVQEFCQMVPDKPATACSIAKAREQEANLDLELLDRVADASQNLDLRGTSTVELNNRYLMAAEVPSGAKVIDCRPEEEFERWHYPGAVNIEYYKLLDSFRELEKSETYLLVCPVGMQSAIVAEKMQADGYLSYSLRGGVKSLQTHVN